MKLFIALFTLTLSIQTILGALTHHPLVRRPTIVKVPLIDGAPSVKLSQSRIVGGVEAGRQQFPFQVAIVDLLNSGFCGGSLISDTWILTAGFCVFQKTEVVLYLGVYDFVEPNDDLQITLANEFRVHPRFEYATINNNIGLIKLKTPAQFTESVQPVNLLLEEQSDLPGKIASIPGWGWESDTSGGVSTRLRYVDLEVIDNFSCRQYYGLIVVTNTTICANGEDGTIATWCAGDMGGPLVLKSAEDEPPVQLGVASFIASVSCERGYPSGYERVAAHADWIADVTGITKHSPRW